MSAVAKSKTKRPVNPPINARPNERSSGNDNRFAEAAARLTEIGRDFYARGWVLGTSGNFSGVTSREPLRLVITSTGLDKGSLTPAQFLEIDEAADVVRGNGRPSAEALHLSPETDRKSTRLNSSHLGISYAVFCLKKKTH